MKKTISLLILAIFATSANGNVMFSDDFESGSLDQWIIGGRQQDEHGGINIAEVIYRSGSQMAHIHHSLDTTEITLEKLLEYCPNLIFNFDMEVSVSSIAGPTDDDYAMGGAFFDFLDSSGELIGFVRYIGSTSSYPFTIVNPSPSREYIALPDSSPHPYSFTLEDILSHITVDTDSIAYINFSFWAYNSGFGWNMSADVWVDNVVVSVPELVGLEITGPDEVAENFSASYKAIAHYDDNSTRDVTDSALWAVEPNTAASIDENGELTTKDIVTHQSATIPASYTEGDVTVEAEKVINIFPTCPTGTALQFDGLNDYVDCGSDSSLDVTELTWVLWIKRTETTYSNERALISNTGPKTGPEEARGTYALQIDEGGQYQDKIQFVRHGMPVEQCPLSKTAINDMNWHHIAVTRYINGDVTIYIDGYENATGYLPERTAYGKTFIGTGHTSYSNFKGSIDEVAIYNRALSAEEIQANIHTRLTGDEPNLVGYWDLDEGEGQIVYDLSGNGNDGYLGVDPCAVDAGDPAWIYSDAPMGHCSLYQIATLATDGAVERKTALLEEVLAALAEEWTAYEALGEWFESGDYVDFNKGDIVTAKQKIHSAIQHEGQQSIDALEKSVEKLKDALSALGYEPDTAANIDENGVLTTKDIVKEESATILASYTEGDVTFEAEKAIDILAICPSGTALQFDGVDDYVYLGDIDEFEFGEDDFSISVWIYPRNHSGSGGHIITKYYWGNEQRQWWLTHSASDAILFYTNPTGASSDGERLESVSPVAQNAWAFITAVRKGSTKYIYINGELDTAGTTAGILTGQSAKVYIGVVDSPSEGLHNFFNGEIDDLRIYNRALDANDIQELMHKKLTGDEAGLVGYWDFDEGGGQIVYDLSGNGNDGQLGSTPEADSSDPAWVDSDAPIGICTPYQIATMATGRAVERKTALLEELLAALAEEWTAYEALEELLESGDYGDLNKGDIVTAKQKIHSATQHEEQAIDALEKSIEKLEDALSALGYEPEPPPPSPPLPGQASNPNPANGATGVSTNADLSWTAGFGAVSHDVYFGTTSPPPFIHNQTSTTSDPGTMASYTTYYWRIDEVNPSGTTTGTVWTFRTGGLEPPPI